MTSPTAGASAAPQKDHGRAGRNLPAAVGVGLGLGALITVPLFSPYRWLFIGVLVLAVAVGTWEIVKALRTLGAEPPLPRCCSAARSWWCWPTGPVLAPCSWRWC